LRGKGGVFCRKLRENATQAEKEKTMAKQESEVLKYDEYLLRGNLLTKEEKLSLPELKSRWNVCP
jgi:hypothetical protein